MKVRVGSFLFLLLFAGIGVASAEVIVDLRTEDEDSGWSAILADDVYSGVVVDAITDSYVRIEIAKTFFQGPEGGQFPANLIEFRQTADDIDPLPVIQITSEAITNDTGWDWTDYHWEIIGDDAAFDRTATENSGFSIDPFTRGLWGAAPAGWSPDHSASLDVDGGTVRDGETFFPGSGQGRLYIDVDVTGQQPVSFVLRQYPTPEPGTMAVLAGGALILLVRPRRRKKVR
jgi:hypothetical protein